MVATNSISLADVPLFAGLTPEMLAPLQATCRQVSLERHETLFRQGNRGKEMYIIASGLLDIWTENEDGHKLHLATLGPMEVVGELEIIDGQPRSANAIALEPTQLIALARDAFFDHIGLYPGMAVHMMTILSDRLRQNNLMQMQLHREHRPSARVAQLILMLAGESRQITLQPQKTAYILGMEVVALERLLAELETDGAISRQDDTISIIDPQHLRAIIAH
jgi:CRP-like cAMP-binding protein